LITLGGNARNNKGLLIVKSGALSIQVLTNPIKKFTRSLSSLLNSGINLRLKRLSPLGLGREGDSVREKRGRHRICWTQTFLQAFA